MSDEAKAAFEKWWEQWMKVDFPHIGLPSYEIVYQAGRESRNNEIECYKISASCSAEYKEQRDKLQQQLAKSEKKIELLEACRLFVIEIAQMPNPHWSGSSNMKYRYTQMWDTANDILRETGDKIAALEGE